MICLLIKQTIFCLVFLYLFNLLRSRCTEATAWLEWKAPRWATSSTGTEGGRSFRRKRWAWSWWWWIAYTGKWIANEPGSEGSSLGRHIFFVSRVFFRYPLAKRGTSILKGASRRSRLSKRIRRAKHLLTHSEKRLLKTLSAWLN